jgi:hypothetical protein
MKFTFEYRVYVTVEAPDEDAAEEAAEAKLDEQALLPLDDANCLRNSIGSHILTAEEDT